ncbi:hypothetical protein NVIRENTERO_01373 [Sodalis praecaptivus]|nr:hypothetical protein NVIRENTERO_01373 [Sodalis praecaptivus]
MFKIDEMLHDAKTGGVIKEVKSGGDTAVVQVGQSVMHQMADKRHQDHNSQNLVNPGANRRVGQGKVSRYGWAVLHR